MLDKDCTSHKPKLQKIKRPFSLEKIKEGLGDMFVKANLLEKVRDLKLKRKLLKLKKKLISFLKEKFKFIIIIRITKLFKSSLTYFHHK